MKPNLSKYANMKICVAVSGGRDSMALLHYIHSHGEEYGITLCAVNCDHKMRGESSAKDSAFVKKWCAERNIPLAFYEWDFDGAKTENGARGFRLNCYAEAQKATGADAVATAHHLNDNAETVLFNLARGSSLSGLEGITDVEMPVEGGGKLKLIRPLIGCTRAEIDAYVLQNGVEYVDDESNFTDGYTRNKIRLNVLPELESAVPDAAAAIYRFSRLAAETEEYFEKEIDGRELIKDVCGGVMIAFCSERALFKRAAIKAVKEKFKRKDYTAEQAERLFSLQFAENGKQFEFLELVAVKEAQGIVICESGALNKRRCEVEFYDFLRSGATEFCGEKLLFSNGEKGVENTRDKALKFDLEAVPENAVLRFAEDGDFFKKFGGGTKSLGDFFTDRKIPLRVRKRVPVVASGKEILIVCGVEISEKVKIFEGSKKMGCLICADYGNL